MAVIQGKTGSPGCCQAQPKWHHEIWVLGSGAELTALLPPASSCQPQQLCQHRCATTPHPLSPGLIHHPSGCQARGCPQPTTVQRSSMGTAGTQLPPKPAWAALGVPTLCVKPWEDTNCPITGDGLEKGSNEELFVTPICSSPADMAPGGCCGSAMCCCHVLVPRASQRAQRCRMDR